MSQRLIAQSVSLSTVTRGRISTAQLIDREDTDMYQLTLTAQDLSVSPTSASIPLVVGVMDVNDNAPMFAQRSWDFTLRENTNNVLIMEFNVCMICMTVSFLNHPCMTIVSFPNHPCMTYNNHSIFPKPPLHVTIQTRVPCGRMVLPPCKPLHRGLIKLTSNYVRLLLYYVCIDNR